MRAGFIEDYSKSESQILLEANKYIQLEEEVEEVGTKLESQREANKSVRIEEFAMKFSSFKKIKEVCKESKVKTSQVKNEIIALNKHLNFVLLDICHLLKASVQRLILTSKVFGYAEMFHIAPLLLEQIRLIISGEKDFHQFFDFFKKLEFIRSSFDFHFSLINSKTSSNLYINLHHLLKSDFLKQIDHILTGVKNSSRPDLQYSSGLGNYEILIDTNFIEFEPRGIDPNEYLWSFIIIKVNEIRSSIEESCPKLMEISPDSIVDLINDSIIFQYENNIPFSFFQAIKLVEEVSKKHFRFLKRWMVSNTELVSLETFQEQIKKAQGILINLLKSCKRDLSGKIEEIAGKLGLDSDIVGSLDLSTIAVFELLKNLDYYN